MLNREVQNGKDPPEADPALQPYLAPERKPDFTIIPERFYGKPRPYKVEISAKNMPE